MHIYFNILKKEITAIYFADDRFILKQMSRYEVQSFLEFAPKYVQYVAHAYNEQVCR